MNPVAKSRTYKMILVALFAALIAVGAFIRIPVPLVPFTMQTFFIVLSGMMLGKKLGAASALVYLAVGLVGFPVFTQGGGQGSIQMLKPTPTPRRVGHVSVCDIGIYEAKVAP